MCISPHGNSEDIPLNRFDTSAPQCYRDIQKILDYIFHRAMLRDIKLDSSSIISNVTLTFFSIYKSMNPKHKLSQPRRVLESKLLKNIKNASRDDKINKYNFLSRKNGFLIF